MPETFCAIQVSQRLIGGKWNLVVLWNLRQGPLFFGELRRAVGSISQKALADAVRDLERAGLLSRTVLPERPPRVRYELTPLGRTLEPIVASIEAWATEHRRALG
jgi:DNA-binding HxlR family transcriptional regulator